MVSCSAFGCKSRSEKQEPGISFHSFPKDLEKRKLWVANMKIANWEPTKYDRICSKHFKEKWLYRPESNVRTRLLNQAIPSIFPELPKYLQPREAIKKVRISEFQPQPGPSVPPSASPHSPPSDLPQPEIEAPQIKKLRRQLFQERLKNKIKKRKIQMLEQSLERYKEKVFSLKQIISELEKNTITKEMLERKQSRIAKFSLELRNFAITLNFFSPKAYNYLRTRFDICLPHSRTIGKWLQAIDASSGFTSESFRTLENFAI